MTITLLEACEGALAALTQHKTFPADIRTAVHYLEAAIDAATGLEHKQEISDWKIQIRQERANENK